LEKEFIVLLRLIWLKLIAKVHLNEKQKMELKNLNIFSCVELMFQKFIIVPKVLVIKLIIQNSQFTIHFTTCKEYWFVNHQNSGYENIRQYGILVKKV
jgi:hypothetical protein